MRLLPKCLNALKHPAFWESTEKPSLKRFLEFRLTEGNLESEEEEHLRYICEINTISKYYTETSEIGQKLLTWNQDFKNDKKSKEITHFWDLQDKRQNVHSEKLLFEEEAKMSQNKLENQIYLEQTRYILDATRERSLLQRTITNRFEKYVSDNTLQPVVSQINENERKRHAEEISHTITTPPNLRPSVEEKKADDHFFFSDQIVKGNEDTSYERRRRCSIPEDNINLEEFPSVTTTTSLYVPSSPPSTSDCNISEEYTIVENRSYSIDYLTGPGVPEWHLNEDSIRWVVNDIDITEICREYRAVVVKKCESMDVTLSATEELILSHVFVFQEQSPLGLCEYFDDELWAELFAEFRGLYPYAPITDKISNLFLNIVKIPCEEPNQTERQKLARRYLRNFDVITEEEEIIIEMFRELVDNERSSFTRNYVVEDTHTIRNITPIILKPFFKNNKRITFEGANKMSESSAIANRRFDPERLGTKPDFTVITTNPQKHVELFIVEIKPNKTNNALVLEDLVSLGKTMKCAIDKSIEDGADDLVICGMQVIGFLGRAYLMDLRFEGIYRMILIGEFELPRGSTSWGTALQCYQVMNIIRLIVNNGAISYQTAIRMNKQSKSKMMIKPMFHNPTKIQKYKQY